MPRSKPHFPAVLIILDGWGSRAATKGNAIRPANTPNMTRLWKKYPHALLDASGTAVGLPPHQAGNSEAGHLNIGAGRVVLQDSVRISRAINDGTFFKNPAFVQAARHTRRHKSNLHLMGMISGDQSPHMDPDHILALLSLCRQHNVPSVVLHLFTDGRDSPPRDGLQFVQRLEKVLDPRREIIGTIAGRLYMDRKKDWERTEFIFNTLVDDAPARTAPSAEAAIKASYRRGETDEFIFPTVITRNGTPTPRISEHDAVIFFNLRSDRARQLTKPFVQKDFAKRNPDSFQPKVLFKHLTFVAMTDFGPDLGDILTAFPSEDLTNTLPMVLKSYRQLYIAETEKYAHVTFFLNGGYSHAVAGETRLLVPSPDVSHYDRAPEMSAQAITDTVISGLTAKRFDFIALNFANADMVGHTGNLAAATKAVRFVDRCIGEIVAAVEQRKGVVAICADHGNAETVIDPATGKPSTQHSSSPVPFIITVKRKNKLKRTGVLAQIAPTLLDTIGVPVPKEMNGGSLWQ